MPSPKSGKAGSPVSPTDPKQAREADVADPGKVAEIKAEQAETKSGKYGTTPVKPHKPPETEEDQKKKKSWIEIELVDMSGDPVAGESYEVKLPDGETVAAGTLDAKGRARVDGIDPGSCEVTFPNLDQTVWEPK